MRPCHKPISQNNHTIFCSGRIYPTPYFVCDKSHRYIVTQPQWGEGKSKIPPKAGGEGKIEQSHTSLFSNSFGFILKDSS
jgi:hypothetical protein